MSFVGAPPKLPRDNVIVGRWTPEAYEGYVGTIARPGAGKLRKVTVPPELADAELYVYAVGGDARKLAPDQPFTPGRRGGYWALACRADTCFVFAATRIL